MGIPFGQWDATKPCPYLEGSEADPKYLWSDESPMFRLRLSFGLPSLWLSLSHPHLRGEG